jgi:hypothetical protein
LDLLVLYEEIGIKAAKEIGKDLDYKLSSITTKDLNNIEEEGIRRRTRA